MLEFLRRNSSSILIQLIFVVIVVVFVFWGMGSNAPPRQVVATVDGVAIKDSEFGRAFRGEVYRQQRSRELKDEDYERIKGEVIDGLVEREVLRQAAEKQGIRVSDEEIRARIMEMEAFFGDDGKFDVARYREILKANGKDDARFENDLREDLAIVRLREVIRRTVLVSADEVRDDYRRRNEKIELEYVRVAESSFRDKVDTGDTKVEGYLGQNGQKVQDYYNSHYDQEFNLPRKVKTAHILLRVADDDTEVLKAKVEAKAQEVAKRAESEDFGALARQYGEDHTARKGGDLGWVDDRRSGAPFGEDAFKQGMAGLKVGKVAGPIWTTQGWEIVKAIEVEEPKQTSFDIAKKEIARKLIQEEEAPALAREFAENLVKPFASGGDVSAMLSDPAFKSPLKVQETGEFGWTEDRIPRIGQSAELAAAAFTLREVGKGPEQVFEVPGAMVVARLKSREEADMAAFEEQKEDAEDALRMRKEMETVEAWIDSLKASMSVKVYDVKI